VAQVRDFELPLGLGVFGVIGGGSDLGGREDRLRPPRKQIEPVLHRRSVRCRCPLVGSRSSAGRRSATRMSGNSRSTEAAAAAAPGAGGGSDLDGHAGGPRRACGPGSGDGEGHEPATGPRSRPRGAVKRCPMNPRAESARDGGSIEPRLATVRRKGTTAREEDGDLVRVLQACRRSGAGDEDILALSSSHVSSTRVAGSEETHCNGEC